MPDDVNEPGKPLRFVEPRATEHIAEMRQIIERLIARGVAYVAEDHVLFSVSSMARLPKVPKYGAFSKRSLDEFLSGARVDVAPYKRDAMDFVLWKPSGPHDPSWPSPGGIATPGRPGWHIECSAMAWKHLIKAFETRLTCEDADERETFDIHGGGIDLVFPHHENEIAQSCCAFDTARMANVWMHNGFLQVESEKMSKSLGNFFTIHDLLTRLARRGAALQHAAHALPPADRLDGAGIGGKREDARSLVRSCGRGEATGLSATESSMRWRTISTRRRCSQSCICSTGQGCA